MDGLLPDLEVVRKDFPILARTTPDGRPLVYLDSANTSQKPQVVIDAMVDHLERHNANVARAMHLLGAEATEAFEAGRDKVAVLDETDSGLDIDALKVVSEGVNRFREREGKGVLLITHYTRILRYIKPDHVHVFAGGKIVESGGAELADKLENEGYEAYTKGGASE